MRGIAYWVSAAIGVAATCAAAAYAFADRGYPAVGGEYAFLALPLAVMCIGYIVDDMRGGGHRNAGR